MNYYAEVIEIVTEKKMLAEAIMIEAAKIAPSVIVKAYRKVSGEDSWVPGAKELIIAGQKIQAIKYCREKTGMGLKEAKEAVENINL